MVAAHSDLMCVKCMYKYQTQVDNEPHICKVKQTFKRELNVWWKGINLSFKKKFLEMMKQLQERKFADRIIGLCIY